MRIATLALALVVALILHAAWRLLRLPSPWPRLFLGTVGRIVGAKAEVTGLPLRRNIVIIANHLSWIDILTLAGATGTAFVAKAELCAVPLIGWLCTLNHTIFVERGNKMGIAAQIDVLRGALAHHRPVTIFPEGTTGDGRTLQPFKASLLAVLDPPPPGIRVQPVTIDYGDATGELAWIGAETGLSHAIRILRRAGSFPVHLRFLSPFDPVTCAGRKAVSAEARSRMLAAWAQSA